MHGPLGTIAGLLAAVGLAFGANAAAQGGAANVATAKRGGSAVPLNQQAGTRAQPRHTLPECPHEWSELADSLRPDSAAIGLRWSDPSNPGQTAAAGATTNVPEFHDCQRLLLRAKPHAPRQAGEDPRFRYGSLSAIFAAESQGPLAWGAVPPGPGAPLWLRVGEVYSDSAYSGLGIRAGFNCLVVVNRHRSYVPLMVSVGWNEAACLKPPLTGPKVTTLTYRVLPPRTGLIVGDVPAVARWDIDAQYRQFIGIKCGERWCEVGPVGGYGPSTQYGAAGASVQRRTIEVKGWYDEQRLALYSTGGARPVPSTVIGTVFAAPALDEYNNTNRWEAAPDTGAWLKAAAMSMSGPQGLYTSKYNITASTAPVQWSAKPNTNELWLCYDKSAIGSASSRRCGISAATLTGCTSGWYGDVRNAAGGLAHKYFCVAKREHPAMVVPGIVRWRWKVKDETIWVSCQRGCCEVDVK